MFLERGRGWLPRLPMPKSSKSDKLRTSGLWTWMHRNHLVAFARAVLGEGSS